MTPNAREICESIPPNLRPPEYADPTCLGSNLPVALADASIDAPGAGTSRACARTSATYPALSRGPPTGGRLLLIFLRSVATNARTSSRFAVPKHLRRTFHGFRIGRLIRTFPDQLSRGPCALHSRGGFIAKYIRPVLHLAGPTSPGTSGLTETRRAAASFASVTPSPPAPSNALSQAAQAKGEPTEIRGETFTTTRVQCSRALAPTKNVPRPTLQRSSASAVGMPGGSSPRPWLSQWPVLQSFPAWEMDSHNQTEWTHLQGLFKQVSPMSHTKHTGFPS